MTRVIYTDTLPELVRETVPLFEDPELSFMGMYSSINNVYYEMEDLGYDDEEILNLTHKDEGERLILVQYIDNYFTFISKDIIG